jgi:MFS family permease
VGVGAGESGAIAPSQSLLIDYFPPGSRATALSVLAAAGTVGSLLAFAVGGYIAALHGWRSAFLCAGAPGLLLALITRMSLAEPRLVLPVESAAIPRESTRETLRTLWRKRSFRYALAGSVFTFLMQYGGLVFVPAFLTRVMGASLAEVSVTYGAVVAAASLTGTLGGGVLADKLGRRDVRWFAWLPALACTVTAPIYVLAFASMQIEVFMALAFVGYVLLAGGSPPVFAAVHAICGASRRAMAIAVLLFAATLFGAGLGPLAAGALSDWLSFSFGPEGLRYSLMAMMSVLPASGVFFYLFGRAMPRDLEP